MEEVCPKLRAAYIALFSDNPPTIGWVKRLAVRGTLVEMQLVLEVTLGLNNSGASPLTPLHIAGKENSMTDNSSRSFGCNLSWFCKNVTDLLNLFNTNLPLPNQAPSTVFRPSNAVSMKIISASRIKHL